MNHGIVSDNFDNELLVSAIGGDLDTVIRLLDSGANIEATNWSLKTPIMLSIYNGNVEVIDLLIERGCNMNITDMFGFDCACIAALNDKKDMVKLLLEKCNNISFDAKCFNFYCEGVWEEEYVQELIINKQPININALDKIIGILPSMKDKYGDIIGCVK